MMRQTSAILLICLAVAAGCGEPPATGDADTTEPTGLESTAATDSTEAVSAAVLAERLGACSPESLALRSDPGYAAEINPLWSLSGNRDWVSIDPAGVEALEALRGEAAIEAARIVFENPGLYVTVVSGAMPSQLRVLPQTWELVTQASDAGHEVWIGVKSALTTSAGDVFAAVMVTEDGEFGFLGDCQYPDQTEPLLHYHADLADQGDTRTPVDVLRALLINDAQMDDATAFFYPTYEPTPWAELDPDLRFLDPFSNTPREVLADLTLVFLALEIPEAWWDLDVGLCTKIAGLGWNGCYALTPESKSPAPDLDAYVAPGEPLEFWLIPETGDIREPLAYLGSIVIPEDALADDIPVRLVDDINSLADIEAATGRGETLIALTS